MTNDAAERLRSLLQHLGYRNAERDLDEALAAERRATVEQADGFIEGMADRFDYEGALRAGLELRESWVAARTAILDAEAER
jgi:hypothetical protein